MAEKTAGVLGIEGGGTRTTWVRLSMAGEAEARGEVGPGNTLLLSDVDLRRLVREIAGQVGGPIAAIGAAFAGCAQATEQVRLEKVLRHVWPKAQSVGVMEDTRSILAAAFGDGPGIVVIAGTGSNVAGQRSVDSPLEKAGGWGHLFADRGSAYDIARRGLEAVFTRYDSDRKITLLACEYLAAAGAASLEELVPLLLRDTSKAQVARLARCVFDGAAQGDRAARDVLQDATEALAGKVKAVAGRMKLRRVQVALTGGLFDNQDAYRKSFEKALKQILPGAKVFLCATPGAVGAARVAGARIFAGGAADGLATKRPKVQPGSREEQEGRTEREAAIKAKKFEARAEKMAEPQESIAASLRPIAEPERLAAFSAASTEQRNPRSRGLDRRTIAGLVELFIREERHVERALAAQKDSIARAAELVAEKLKAGGRLIYVGAGTSGRLGVVDASEMPPTFNAPPEQIQAIMAGGRDAVFKSKEGAEDDRGAAAAELGARGLSRKDVVCGIAASGQTPFVLGALEAARRVGAGTILLSCNPRRTLRVPVDVEIDLPTGPELVTGSTRLKAGTATKLVLNMLSTIAMVRLGRVADNLMINVQATNDKLRARAVRLVQALGNAGAEDAQRILEAKGWSVPASIDELAKTAGKFNNGRKH